MKNNDKLKLLIDEHNNLLVELNNVANKIMSEQEDVNKSTTSDPKATEFDWNGLKITFTSTFDCEEIEIRKEKQYVGISTAEEPEGIDVYGSFKVFVVSFGDDSWLKTGYDKNGSVALLKYNNGIADKDKKEIVIINFNQDNEVADIKAHCGYKVNYNQEQLDVLPNVLLEKSIDHLPKVIKALSDPLSAKVTKDKK